MSPKTVKQAIHVMLRIATQPWNEMTKDTSDYGADGDDDNTTQSCR